MAEEAAILGWMGFEQRCFGPWAMTGLTGFFRLVLFHVEKPFMVRVMGQWTGRFKGSREEEKENAGAGRQKKTVVEDVFLFGGHGTHSGEGGP